MVLESALFSSRILTQSPERMNPHSLVILGCSKLKKQTPRLLPAIDRYDGPLFHLLRKYARDEPLLRNATYILSAKFGLIPSDFPTPAYDQQLSSANKSRLEDAVARQVCTVVEQLQPDGVFVSVGADYWQLLKEPLARSITKENLFLAKGSIGGRASQLRNWLKPAETKGEIKWPSGACGEASLLGTTVRMTPKQIESRANEALVSDYHRATRLESWFVQIGNHRVAPKWLVSFLFNIPVARFRTADARKILHKLGIETLYAHQ
jgi:hypothetical protein